MAAAWILSICCACGATEWEVSQEAVPAEAQDTPDTLPPAMRIAIRYHAEHLAHPGDAELRRLGAKYLLEMRLPEATAALDAALRGGNADVILAVIGAIEETRIAPRELLDGLALALNTVPPEQIEGIARVLSFYGEAGSQKVAEVALDAAHELEVRVGAVTALGELRDPQTVRNCVDALIQILQREGGEPPEIQNAAFDSLDRLTRLSFGRDVKAWTEWWLRTRAKPLSEWLPDEFQRLDSRLEDTMRQLAAARGETDAIRVKLEELMGEVYFLLKDKSATEMQAKLAAWLGDRMPAVRKIALSRVESRAGNGEMPTAEVTLALVDRLKDADAELRRRAARLLDRVRYEETGVRVAEALVEETNFETRLAFLEILKNRPTPSAAPTLLALILDPPLRDASAAALNELVRSGRLPEEHRAATLVAARGAFAAGPSAPVIRLVAAVGEQQDIDAIVPLLDHLAVDVRTAAAESLRPVPSAEAALLAHAGDAAVFPSVVDMLASGAATSAQCSVLLNLNPPDETLRQRWRDGIVRLCSRVPPAELATVDAALAAVPPERMTPADLAALREQFLSTVLTLPPDALASDVRAALVATLARLRLQLNQPESALAALDRLHGLVNGDGVGTNGAEIEPLPEPAELRNIRFAALIRLQRFDDAAAIHDDPAPWLAAMQEVIESDAALAALVKEQIDQRFTDRLAEDQRQQLAALAARLPAQESPPGGGGGGEGDGAAGTTQDQSSDSDSDGGGGLRSQ